MVKIEMGTTSSSDVVLAYIQIHGPKLVGICGHVITVIILKRLTIRESIPKKF